MIAVDESTPENGCPAVAPGHHLHGLYSHTREGSFQFDDERAPNDEAQWLPCPLQRGEAAVDQIVRVATFFFLITPLPL